MLDREKVKGDLLAIKTYLNSQAIEAKDKIVRETFMESARNIDDAIALLKEQEARIFDWDELEDWGNAVWFEDKDEHECYIALIANVGTYDAKFTNVEPGNIHSLVFMRDFYMKEWRCWSARPTIKQRHAVKWE